MEGRWRYWCPFVNFGWLQSLLLGNVLKKHCSQGEIRICSADILHNGLSRHDKNLESCSMEKVWTTKRGYRALNEGGNCFHPNLSLSLSLTLSYLNAKMQKNKRKSLNVFFCSKDRLNVGRCVVV